MKGSEFLRGRLLCVVLSLSGQSGNAQVPDSGYQIIYSYKVTAPGLVLDGQRSFVLDNGKHSLSFLDASTITQSGDAKGDRFIRSPDKPRKPMSVYKDLGKGVVVFEISAPFMSGKNTLFNDTLHPMKWEIDGGEKMIDSLNCISATCSFRGRDYTAWFAPSIPINQGPWKFGGLPGLIVYLTDSDRKYEWKLISFAKTLVEIPDAPVAPENYRDFINSFYGGARKAIEAARAREGIDPNCIECLKKTSVKIETFELF